MLGKFNTCAAIWGKLYKKEILNGLDFNQEISQGGEDLLYLYQALYQAKTLITTFQRLYFYRARPDSVVTSKLSERFVLGNIKTAELLANDFKSKKLSSKTRKILNQKIAKRIFKFAVLARRWAECFRGSASPIPPPRVSASASATASSFRTP